MYLSPPYFQRFMHVVRIIVRSATFDTNLSVLPDICIVTECVDNPRSVVK